MLFPKNSKLLYDAKTIDFAINKMAVQISLELADKKPVFLSIMNGGLIFTADLLRRVSIPLQLDHLHATRYIKNIGQDEVLFHSRPQTCLKNRHVVLVDDVFDRGITLAAVAGEFNKIAQSVRIAVLIEKDIASRPVSLQPDYIGLKAPDSFLFGRGMDYNGWYRNLTSIYQIDGNK